MNNYPFLNYNISKKTYSILRFLTFLIVFALILLSVFAFKDGPSKVLVFGNKLNKSEVPLPLSKMLIDLKLDTYNISFTDFTEEKLNQYSSLVCLSSPFESLDNKQQNDIERYFQAGGTLVLGSSIPDSIINWPWYTCLKDAIKNSKDKNVIKYDGGHVYLYDQKNEKSFRKQFSSALKKNKLDYSKVATERVPESSRFNIEILDTYLYEPMEMVIFKDGRILFLERRGEVKLYDPKTKKSRVIDKFDVSITGNYEDGMLGITLDPDYEKNNYVYIMYSPSGNIPKQNVSRFKFVGDSLIRSSEKIVLEVPTQRETCCHSGGHLEFGPNNDLYISTGDNTSSKESDGFTPIDERPGRAPFDAQKSSGNTHDLRGKILRIHPEADGSYTVPDGNLFPKDGSQGKPEIYVMGARNPFRFTVDDKNGYVYWGDVGPDGGRGSDRGPQSYDEFNQAKKPGNYGWPYFVADNKAYSDFDFATNKVGPKFDPERPENTSVYNTGSKILPPAQKAMIWYPYGESKEFPILGKGSRSAMAGPVYYQDQFKDGNRFPKYFDGKLFIYEWARSWVKLVSFDKNGDLSKIEDFLPDEEWFKPIDIKFGPDGSLYVLQYGANYFEHNPDSRLIKITYVEGNRQPVAKLSADKTVGSAPMTVNLSAEKSFDYDKDDQLTFSWSSSGNEVAEDASAKVSFTYSRPGIYHPSVTITDKEGKKATTQIEIKVGNELPEVKIDLQGANKSFYSNGQSLNYKVLVRDKEDGTLEKGITPSSVFVSFDYLKEGKDLALLTSNNQMAGGVQFIKGKTLLETSDCKSCHDITKQSIGPSYTAIAFRYKGKQANDMLSEKILKGGNGNWGKNMMAAHPQHKKDEADEMVKYILSLSEKQNMALPLQGTLALTEHEISKSSGYYIIRAAYSDKGGDGIGPLTGSALLALRNPKVQAEDFELSDNAGRRHVDGTNLTFVSNLQDGSFIGFQNIDLTGISIITAKAGALIAGSKIEVRIDNPNGKIIGQGEIRQTSKEEEMNSQQITVSPTEGQHNLFIVFRNTNKSLDNIAYIDWIYFGKGTSVPPSE